MTPLPHPSEDDKPQATKASTLPTMLAQCLLLSRRSALLSARALGGGGGGGGGRKQAQQAQPLLSGGARRGGLSAASASPGAPPALAASQEQALLDPEGFWMEVATGAEHGIPWFKPPRAALDASRPPFYRWFPGGELNSKQRTTNALSCRV